MGATDAQEWVQAGREFSAEEIGEIRETVAWLPGLARRELAATVCEHLHWHTAAGTAKLQACQKLLERLAAAGLLDLPALRRKKNHNGNRCVVALSERTATDRPLAGPLRALEPVRLEVVTEASDEGLWNEYVDRFHPLGYKGAFGYRLRYFIRSGTQRLGCVLLAGAARAIAVRDRWIGWNDRARLRNLPRVVNNSRFLIFLLEANLAFHNGMAIPPLSEFLQYAKGDTENNKQDCEQRAFHRLSERLKALFPRLPVLLLRDGLYANGPVMPRCHQLNWQFMIVLKDKDLPTAWEEFESLQPLQPESRLKRTWGDRQQRFSWVNAIEYEFTNAGRQRLSLHVVVCEETWQMVDEHGQTVTKTARHAWLSSRPLTWHNVHERCNLGARYRWGIEAGFLVEKHQGYHYEHAFALNWNAMKGYHYLMRMAHLFNTLARFARHLKALYAELGVRGTIAFVRQSCAAPWLDPERIRSLLSQPFQLQLE